jgi:DNA polymerase
VIIAHVDIETYSEEDLKSAGMYRYAEHGSTEITVCCYRFEDTETKKKTPVHIWIPYEALDIPRSICDGILARPEYDGGPIFIQTHCPQDLADHITAGGQLRAHNAAFERVNINKTAGTKLAMPKIKISQMVCTAAKAAAHGLPRALEDAATARGTHAKMATGKNDMRSWSKPKKATKAHPFMRYMPDNDPERYIRLCAYCIDDVKAESALDESVPDLSASEQQVWELDQLINDRGIQADLVMVGHIQHLVAKYKAWIEEQFIAIVGVKPTQREKIADWVRDRYTIYDLQAETVRRAVVDPKCPEEVRKVLRMYSTYGMKAVSKYGAIEAAVCRDSRLHGMFLYYGAGTGRWSSLIVQLQNLFRPVIDDCDTAIDLFSARDLDLIRMFYDIDPMRVFASCIRGMLVAKPGMVLQALDFAGIEARGTAWLYDEEWKLDAFRLQDLGLGPDNYKIAYANVFQISVDQVDKSGRQKGKAFDLFGGYEGGVGAFVTMAATYGVNLAQLTEQAWGKLPESAMEKARWMLENGYLNGHGLPERTLLVCDAIKQVWRSKHPNTVDGWKQMKAAAVEAVKNPGRVYAIDNKKIMFKVEGDWLYMRLPSGRRLAYYKPEVAGEGRNETLSYLGIDTETRRWIRTYTYGGKLTENAVQALSRDLLVHGMRGLEAAGYTLVGSVHDEAISEIPENFGSLEAAMMIFTILPKWAAGLPLAAEGFRAKRYRK